MNKKIKYNCYRCGFPINEKDHQIHLLTLNRNELIEDVRFHFKCWGEFNMEKVNDKFNDSLRLGYMKLGELLG